MKQEKYKVIIREKLTLAVMEESDLISGCDSWISACIKRDAMWEDFKGDKDQYEISIIEVNK